MFLELIFFDNFFLFSIVAKCVSAESCSGDLMPTSPKGPKFEAQIFVCIDEDFVIN